MRAFVPLLMLAAAASAPGQISTPPTGGVLLPVEALASPTFFSQEPPPMGDGAQELLDFRDADIKFSLNRLMDILRDHQHEGWVLAAYPDPTTRRPLIGAGFSLDVPATPHPQSDPLNPQQF